MPSRRPHQNSHPGCKQCREARKKVLLKSCPSAMGSNRHADDVARSSNPASTAICCLPTILSEATTAHPARLLLVQVRRPPLRRSQGPPQPWPACHFQQATGSSPAITSPSSRPVWTRSRSWRTFDTGTRPSGVITRDTTSSDMASSPCRHSISPRWTRMHGSHT